MQDKNYIVLGSVFILLALVSFVNIIAMGVIQGLYPIYLLMFILVLDLLLLLSGIGLLFKKKWTFYAFFLFSMFFLVLAFISQFGLLKQDWATFLIVFLVVCVVFIVIGRYVKNYVVSTTPKR